jgi:enoyl-CoA hydratase/carnithine racemase
MSFWSTETRDGVVVATYSNPPMNYATGPSMEEFGRLVESWKDPAVRAVVLCGHREAGAFITHFRVEDILEVIGDREALRVLGTAFTRSRHELRTTLRNLPKPVITAMNGNTMGGGFEIALSTDIRIGQRGDYRYGLPEVAFGIIPGGSGTQRLSRLIGAGRALEFIMRSRVVTPEVALELGVINEIADDAVARAVEIAAEIARLPPRAIAAAKIAVYTGSDTHLQAGLEIEGNAVMDTLLSDDARTAMQTYVALPYEARRDWLEHGEHSAYTGR